MFCFDCFTCNQCSKNLTIHCHCKFIASFVTCGTDGGVKLKEPLIEICGNFKCGNDQLKFIIDLILLIAPETTDLHPFQMLVNEDLIPFNTPVTVDFAPFIPLEIVDLIPFITEDTVDLIPFQTLLNTDLIEFKILVIVDFNDR